MNPNKPDKFEKMSTLQFKEWIRKETAKLMVKRRKQRELTFVKTSSILLSQ